MLDESGRGSFSVLFIVPAASTWSRARNSKTQGPPPLRSRCCSLGIDAVNSMFLRQVFQHDQTAEFCFMALEMRLEYQLDRPSLFVAPEDRDGNVDYGPSSLWQLAAVVHVMWLAAAHVRASFGLWSFHTRQFSSAIFVKWYPSSLWAGQSSGPRAIARQRRPSSFTLRGTDTSGQFLTRAHGVLSKSFWTRVQPPLCPQGRVVGESRCSRASVPAKPLGSRPRRRHQKASATSLTSSSRGFAQVFIPRLSPASSFLAVPFASSATPPCSSPSLMFSAAWAAVCPEQLQEESAGETQGVPREVPQEDVVGGRVVPQGR